MGSFVGSLKGFQWKQGNQPLLEARKPTQNPKIQKTLRSHEHFRKVRANFCLLSSDTSQEPNGNCSEKLVQMNFFILGWNFSAGFSSCDLWLLSWALSCALSWAHSWVKFRFLTCSARRPFPRETTLSSFSNRALSCISLRSMIQARANPVILSTSLIVCKALLAAMEPLPCSNPVIIAVGKDSDSMAVTVRSPWIPQNYGKYSPTDPIL